MSKKRWSVSEVEILIDNYANSTIKELIELLPGRDADSINSKIKRLKKDGLITSDKCKEAINRAYRQRSK